VTGGAHRIGREIALALGRAGADVVVHFRASREAAEEVCGELAKLGVGAAAVGADLAEPDEAEGLVDRARAAVGGLDLLVNSASIFPIGGLDAVEWSDLDRNLRVNAWAPFVLARQLAERVRGSPQEAEAPVDGLARASVVNLLDTRIRGGDPDHAAYHLSKVVLAELTRMSALELAPFVRVNAVAPGPALPPEGRDDAYLRGRIAALPLGRLIPPSAIAEAVLYLLSAESVTGQILFVDGGSHLRPGGTR